MNCVNHGERTGINTCSVCGDWLCAECSIEMDNRYYCKKCAAEAVSGSKPKREPDSKAASPEREFWDDYRSEARGRKRYVSKFLVFVLAFLPGLNFMYMSLLKRGLFYMCAFFLSIYLVTVFPTPLFGFLIPIIFFVSFFDGFRIRRMIVEGEYVTDGIADITALAQKHRVPLVIVTAVILAIGALGALGDGLRWFMRGLPMVHRGDFGETFLAIIIVAAAVYFVVRRRKNYKDKR